MNQLTEVLLSTMQQATSQGYVLPVSVEAAADAAWGVAGRQEVPWSSAGLRHLELTLSQIKAALQTLLSGMDRVGMATN